MEKWVYALGILAISVGFAAVAAVWEPPEKAYYYAIRALQNSSRLHIQIQGTIQGTPLKGDLVASGTAGPFFRISYLPLKLLNNQWIDLSQDATPAVSRIAQQDLLRALKLTKRLPAVKVQGMRMDRYAFVVSDNPLLNILPALKGGAGEIWLTKKERLPLQLQLTIPQGATDLSRIELQMQYNDPFSSSAPLAVRPLEGVLTQLGELQSGKRVAPEKLASLRVSNGRAQAFYADFDYDGLSDALEIFYGTDPANPDTDNDAIIDGEEIAKGSSPVGGGALNN